MTHLLGEGLHTLELASGGGEVEGGLGHGLGGGHELAFEAGELALQDLAGRGGLVRGGLRGGRGLGRGEAPDKKKSQCHSVGMHG